MGEFEKDIREMFQDLEISINTDQLWMGIEKRLDKKDRKFPVWWILLPVLLLIFSGTLMVLNNTLNKNTGHRDYPQKPVESIYNTNSDALTPETRTPKRDEIENIKAQPTENRSNKVHKKPKGKNSFGPIAQKNINAKGVFEPATDAISIVGEKTIEKQETNNDITSEVNSDRKITVNLIPLIVSGLDRKDMILEYNKPFGDFLERESQDTKGFWSKSLDMGMGFALVDKKLSTSNTDFTSYLEKRVQTESYLESINADILFNFRHSSGFFISTGLNYTQVDERFKDVDSIDIYEQNDGITKEIQEGDGSISYLRGQKEVIQHISWDKIIYNYYSFIEIPFYAGYSFSAGKVNMEFSGGISYNLKLFKKGQIIGTEGFPVDIANEKDIFKSSTGLSFLSGLKILVPYRKHTFYFQPAVKYHLQNIADDKYPLEQRYLWYGAKLGYRFAF